MTNVGFLVPRPSKCPDCNGQCLPGCEKCAGTGAIFKVGKVGSQKTWPDTREGYDAAEKELNNSLMPTSTDEIVW
jgi:hypothetical protein